MLKTAYAIVLGLLFTYANVSFAESESASAEAGRIKTLKGQASVQRGSQILPATVGMRIYASDTVITGKDGTAGLTLNDGTRLTAGPNSTLALNAYQFNPTTHAGELDASLKSGVLAVVSGKLSKSHPEQVKYRTQHSIVGVRGTEFIIEANTAL